MKCLKQAFGEFHKYHRNNERKIVSLTLTFENNIIIRKRIADTVIVDGVTCMRKNVITRVVIRFYDTTLSTE